MIWPDISRLPGAFVIATESAYTYKNKTLNVQAVCAELGFQPLPQKPPVGVDNFSR